MDSQSGRVESIGVKVFVGAMAILLAAASGLGQGRGAEAHPSGTFTVNRHMLLKLSPGELRLTYTVDYSEIPSLIWSITSDTDGDGTVSTAEMSAFLPAEQERIARELSVRVGGSRLALNPRGHTARFVPTDMGVETLWFRVTFEADVTGQEGLTSVEVDDRSHAGIEGWRAVTVLSQPGSVVAGAEGLDADPSDGLTVAPADWLTIPPKQSAVAFEWDPASGRTPPAAVAADQSEALPTTPSMPSAESTTAWAFLLSLFGAMLLGVADAAGPGHGKTIVGSFMARGRARFREAVLISTLVAVFHSAVVVSLAVVTLKLSQLLLPDLVRWLGVGAGMLIVVLGLLIPLPKTRGRLPHLHRHHPASGGTARSSILVAGAAALLPCPTGLVLMLAAIAGDGVAHGVALVVAFSTGTALVALAVGVGAVALGRLPSTLSGGRLAYVTTLMPAFAGAAMVLSGVFVVTRAMTGSVL